MALAKEFSANTAYPFFPPFLFSAKKKSIMPAEKPLKRH